MRYQSLPRQPCLFGLPDLLIIRDCVPKAGSCDADVRWGMRWVDIYFYIFKEESWPICTGLWTKHLLVLILCSWLELCSTRNILLVEAPSHLPPRGLLRPCLESRFFDGPVKGGAACTAPMKWEMIRGVMFCYVRFKLELSKLLLIMPYMATRWYSTLWEMAGSCVSPSCLALHNCTGLSGTGSSFTTVL
mgnify:CR=1 FL=1